MIDVRDFIEKFRDIYKKSPQCGSWTRASENCDYGDVLTVSKDCYMCYNSGNCRDAYYCEDSRALKDCIDCAFSENCELCYECTDCDTCYNSNFCQDCSNCSDIYFSYDLRRCKNCFGCVTIRDKQYCIFNEQYSKKEYEKKLKELDWTDSKIADLIEQKVSELKIKMPRMFVHQFDTFNCTGDYIYHSKNCHECFDTRHTEDSGYIIQANLDKGTKDSYDCGPIPTGMDLCYDASHSHYLFNCDHVYWCGNLKDCKYCTNCFESENLFGCHYLQHKQNAFYILNEKVDEKYFLETTKKLQKELYEKGIYTLYDLLNKELKEKENVISGKCAMCGDGFTLTEKEIEFYKKRDVPHPIYCPACRSEQRIKMRNERKMYKRICDRCKNTLISTYPANSEFIVYCLNCYWKDIG